MRRHTAVSLAAWRSLFMEAAAVRSGSAEAEGEAYVDLDASE
jgi:hypothetical protein